MLIDAHQHYWQLGEHDQSWPTPELAPIYRDFLPVQWEEVARPLQFSGSVLVQSQPSAQDTEWLLRLASATPFIKAVVGWTDLKAPDAPSRIAALAANEKLRGLRPMLQSLPDEWISDPALDGAIIAMIDNDLRFDALVYARHLPRLGSFAQRWPKLGIVIDHGAKPAIADGGFDAWHDEIARIAELPNVQCKLSGLFTEMAPVQDRDALRPYIEQMCASFGPERLMWGSDWPVILLAGQFDEWFAIARDFSSFDEVGLTQLFGATAARFYQIEE